MSDDDLIRRGDAILSVNCALNRGVMEQRLRSLPAVPPAAERLARASLAWYDASQSDLNTEAYRAIETEWVSALAAFRGMEAAPPAAEPAIFQKPVGSCDEGAVRCNNPEPAAQPFRHGRCCAEEPKEPAPCPSPYARCGGHGWIGNPNPAPPDGMDSMDPCPGCPDCVRAAKEPAPCPVPDCLDGYVPSQPDGEPEPCGRCHPMRPEPAPCVGTNCSNPRCNYMVLCGMICNKCGSIAAKAACSSCRPGGAA